MATRVRDGAVVVVFGVALLLTLLQPWWGRDRLGPAEVVEALRTSLPALTKPGDLVVIHPPWRDDIVAAVRAAHLLPADVFVTEAFTRRRSDPWPPIVVVAEGVHPWPASLEGRRRALGVEVVERDGVRLFRLPGDGAATPLVVLSTADVRVQTSEGRELACPWDDRRRRHVCPGLGSWMTIGEETMQIDGRRELCTWSHPISGGRLRIDYGTVDVGNGRTFEAALSDVAVKNPQGAPVRFIVLVDDEPRALTVHRRRGFSRLELPGGVHHLVVEVLTDHDGQRHACHRFGGASP
jgi:hypothetical protein